MGYCIVRKLLLLKNTRSKTCILVTALSRRGSHDPRIATLNVLNMTGAIGSHLPLDVDFSFVVASILFPPNEGGHLPSVHLALSAVNCTGKEKGAE